VPTYPYTSGQGAVAQTIAQRRKGFPPKVDAGYLQRFGIAPANESYIISILRFLDLIDEDGGQRDENVDFFFRDDEAFKPGLEKRLRDAYSQLFDEMGDDALTAERDALTNSFRAADKTSALVGQRQASTFQTLAALAGYGDVPLSRAVSRAKKAESSARKPKTKTRTTANAAADKTLSPQPSKRTPGSDAANGSDVGLTVRIEVNLPPGGDANTYDAIFASIKKHLMS
jgi:Family of unknown function (DUF5343)